MSTDAFPLPEEDRAYLDATFPDLWSTVTELRKQGIIVYDFGLPKPYTPETTDLMLIIPPEYPVGMVDMFYFAAKVQRKDGIGIDALSNEYHFGKEWQRWSRHYPWNAGTDSIITHIEFVKNQLQYEVRGRGAA